MLFLTKWTVLPGKRDEAVKRFMETGAPPPTDVKLLGRWHTLGELGGITIASADDATSMYGWMYQWSDLLEEGGAGGGRWGGSPQPPPPPPGHY
jgi:hypothetical protein